MIERLPATRCWISCRQSVRVGSGIGPATRAPVRLAVSTISTLDQIGEDHVVVESDYPHGDGTWPDTQAHLRAGLDGLPADEVRKITWENASKLFRHPVPATLQVP